MPAKKLRISEAADTDIDDIWLFISQDSEESADRVIERLYDSFYKLAEMPGMGRKRSEFTDDESFLFWSSGSYMIVYHSAKDQIEIVRILHTSRDIAALL